MKLNIFRIPHWQWGSLKKKLKDKGLVSTSKLKQDGWSGDFLFSTAPTLGSIEWVKAFSDYIGEDDYRNRSYFGAMLMKNKNSHYAISFGKAHFYIRPFCDYDFGVELAKRIADEEDVAQTSSRRYQGRQRKDIRSFAGQTRLSVPPGSSIDFLQGRVISEKKALYGSTAKFGTSALLDPDIAPADIGKLLSDIEIEMENDPQFKLPRTLILSDEEEIARYDEKLIDELVSPHATSEIASESFDLFGVDFIFSSPGTFSIKCGNYKAWDLNTLTMKEIKDYIREKQIPRKKVLSLKVTHCREGEPVFTQPIKEAVDFISDDERVVLRAGKWLRFNEDYLQALDSAIRRIEVEETESHLEEIHLDETAFNESLVDDGYQLADKDFAILKTSGKAPTEAWDLQRNETVYAVKFGTPQRLNYVVDQANSVLDLIHNGANLNELPPFKRYCLWFGYCAKKRPKSLADSRSIILKQKVEAWARQCREIGFIPVLKISRKQSASSDAMA